MKTVGMYEAKTHLPRIVAEVEKGETYTLTRHGHPVALIQPTNSAPESDVKQVIEDMEKLREEGGLKGVSLKEFMEFAAEGRR